MSFSEQNQLICHSSWRGPAEVACSVKRYVGHTCFVYLLFSILSFSSANWKNKPCFLSELCDLHSFQRALVRVLSLCVTGIEQQLKLSFLPLLQVRTSFYTFIYPNSWNMSGRVLSVLNYIKRRKYFGTLGLEMFGRGTFRLITRLNIKFSTQSCKPINIDKFSWP